MARMPSTLGERAVPRATRRIASYDPSGGLAIQQRGIAALDVDMRPVAAGNAALAGGLGDLGAGIQKASNILYAKAEEERIKDEERAFKNLEVEWSKTRREILFGNGTPNKPGFFATQGEDTLNARKSVEEELGKARGRLLGKATNANVKQAFDLSSQGSLQGELEQVDRYTMAQRREANIQTSQAAIEEAVQQSSTYFSDGSKWNLAVDRIATEISSMGDELGWSQDKINNETQKQISQAARLRINRALIQDASSAEAIYADSKDMIDGDMKIQIEQDLKAAKKAEETERRIAAAEARQAIADADDAAFDEHATAILTGLGDPKAIALDDRLSGRSKFALASALEQKLDKPVKTDPEAFNTAFSQIHSGKITDWQELVPLVEKKLVDFQDFNILRGEIEKQDTAEGKQQNMILTQTLSYAERVLTSKDPDLGFSDPKGEENLQKATVAIIKAFDKGVKDGIDPIELGDPDSPHYVGKVIKTLERPLSEIMADRVKALQGLGVTSAGDEASASSGPGARAVQQSPAPVLTQEQWAEAPAGTKYRKEGDPETTVRIKK